MSESLNRCFMRFENRAERITAKQVAETFVSVGPLLDLLQSRNNQLMYGRRGTGKTHALRYFQSLRNTERDLAIYIDAQTLGSNGSIYNDVSLPLAERASRLLVDVCSAIHHELLEIFTDPTRGFNLSEAAEYLDGFVDAFTETRFDGPGEKEETGKATTSNAFGTSLNAVFSSSPNASVGLHSDDTSASEQTTRVKSSGSEGIWIAFGQFGRAIRRLAKYVEPRRIWVLIDEWTTVPTELQPYLADLLRRAMFSVPNVTVKIAAIEHRANFKLDRADEGYIGLEVGADINAAINLDDYLVIDNDENRSKQFFRNFVAAHTQSIASEMNIPIVDQGDIISTAFTQDNVFTEFVRATEGVPRDAMHILANAAQKANAASISMPIIRTAAFNFFQAEKYTAIQSNKDNRVLLEWIRDEVIGGRKTKAFLLPVSESDIIIDRLFDRRALHILNRNRSAAHRPGERFIIYKLDYGLYIDLVNTDKYPMELLLTSGGDIDFDVPTEDARSYRRAILDLDKFYDANPDIIRRS